ncbi:MAG: DNA repair protein RadC [Thermoanaerobaculales bacterium]
MYCIRDMEPSQRPRERLLEYGVSSLSDAELIAILIRTGRRGCGAVTEAHRLLAEVGGLAGVARLDLGELTSRPGLGPAKASTILAALELGQRVAKAELRTAERLDQPQIAGEFLVRRLGRESREVFGFLSLDGRHRFVSSHELTLGTRTQAPVDAAELFRLALQDRASGVLLFHNHPSGDLEPSRDDLDLTRRLVRGGLVVGVTVLDHLIVAGGRWLSLRSTRADLFAG